EVGAGLCGQVIPSPCWRSIGRAWKAPSSRREASPSGGGSGFFVGGMRGMTVKMFYGGDCPERLGEKVAILGYGSQGHAHAQNLKDSSVDVLVGLYPGSKSRPKAERHGLRVEDVAEAVKEADVVVVLTPDVGQARLYRQSIEPPLRPGMML